MNQQDIDRVTAGLVDAGKIIEAGWEGLRAVWVPADAPPAQVIDMRMAFFAGAMHLFTTLTGTSVMDPGEEITERDLQRMKLILQELEVFGKSIGALPPNRRPA